MKKKGVKRRRETGKKPRIERRKSLTSLEENKGGPDPSTGKTLTASSPLQDKSKKKNNSEKGGD